MHEFGLAEPVVDAARTRAKGRRVANIAVNIGVLHRIEPAAFDQAFELATTDTELEGATATITAIPARLQCQSCNHEADVTDPLSLCPQCGSAGVSLSGGDDLVLTELTYAAESQT